MSQLSMFESDDEVGSIERWCRTHDLRWIVGVDEAGRGPLAGPVHTAAVALDVEAIDDAWLETLDDSKKLEPDTREELFEHVRDSAPAYEIVSRSAERIDAMNILEATRDAMRSAVQAVADTWDDDLECVLIDGDTPIDVTHRQRTVVDGDGLSYAIAAASILAKVARDRYLIECHERWPAYGFDSNKGYPTPDHRRALEQEGPCPIHRKSFGSVPSSS